MEKNIIKGIIARDNTNWQTDFENEVKDSGCGVMWKDQISDFNEIKEELRQLIVNQGFFDFFNIAKSVSNYHGKIVDFATKDDYPEKMQVWKKRNPAWFSKSFDGYSNGSQKAIIAFLVEDFASIPDKERIHINQFVTYNKKHASIKNAVAFTDIITTDKIKQQTMINIIKELLISNKNLILTGAPGTGKTYLAKQIAETMGCTENEIGFVQFHPSYDYTDFVEGLRPKNKNGNVGFERKDGVFKEFCKKALGGSIIESGDDFALSRAYDALIDKIENEEFTSFTQKTGTKLYVNSISSKKNIVVQSEEEFQKEDGGTHLVSYNRLKKLLEKYNTLDSFSNMTNLVDSITKVIGGCNASAYWAVATYLLNEMKDYSQTRTKKDYVFIIDEINRGEISKIFGELFFSIDPGYRGKDGKIQTQYQNLISESDLFCDGFFVPKNVYIIGTMNDIDRSVESMDFAFRRRFAFKEIKAIDRIEMLFDTENGIGEYAEKAKNRMIHLNEELEKIEGLSSAYHVGPAYFLKLKNYDGNFSKLWEYHLEGLLREYLRGMQDVEGKIKVLKEAYENENDPDDGQQQ